ncbi:uncharacterized protein RHOBADRAFT_54535 [Rhodotorula graminis WP1]|uniref:Gfd2/YDR514C-like C-terminal domain-containing protein n=1 Tax=Rhodotorula graminis (strain WP1) TaxID=578459 RepID=A0A0P9IW12_RHOGW|nr:uncharacterized protein RHOBADRAFT_54535 [Rhodotorula graminis WP1]KPV73951.1 hypothetical protein RHOBADRAFT_54535 [Rhodotorula graminis WP1]
MLQKLAGELDERVGSPCGAAARPASAAVVESRDASPSRLSSSKRAARAYADWAWRTQRGRGVLRWKEFRRWRNFLVQSAGGDLFRRFKLLRPSSWLPKGEPPVELRKFVGRDGQIQLAVRHTDLGRIERHMVDSGMASPAQVAQAWRSFAASKGALIPVYKGDLVTVTDDLFAQHLDDMTEHNAPIVAAYKMARAVAEASATPASSALPDYSTLGPPPSAPSSPPSPAVDDPLVAPVSDEATATLSDPAKPVELVADPLEDLDDALREVDQAVVSGARRPSRKKDWMVHWGQIVEGCKSCSTKHFMREKAQPGTTLKGILAMLPLTPAKLFESTLALDFEDSTFAHVGPDGTRSVLLRHKVLRDALRDFMRRCGHDRDAEQPLLRFPVVRHPDIHDFPGAVRLGAASVADIDRAWAAAGRPVPAQRTSAASEPIKTVKSALPVLALNWAQIVEACRACNEAYAHAHTFKKTSSAVPALVAMLPLTPAKLFKSAAPGDIYTYTFKHTPDDDDGPPSVLVGYKFALRAVTDLARRCAIDPSEIDRLRFPLPPRSSAARLVSPDLLGAKSIEDVERAWQAVARRHAGPVPGPVVDSPVSKKRPVDAVAASPSPTPASSVPTTPALSSVESTPEPPSKRARTTATVAAVPRPAPAPVEAPVKVPVVVVEDEHARRASLDEAKERGATHFELETLRLAHAHARQHGAAAFLSIDIEMWEHRTNDLLEFGWSTLEFVKNRKTGKVETRRDTQHAVVKENAHRRNGRYSPDNRDNFAFGRTVRLPQQAIYHTLAALLHTLSAHAHVFLIFHDPRADLRALDRIGFDTAREFEPDLRRLGSTASAKVQSDGGKVWVVDTQRLFSAWLNRKVQAGLEKACVEVQVPTKPALLHNAANDAYYTLNLFERLMDRQRTPSPTSKLIQNLDERARVDAERKRSVAADKARRVEERREQTALAR